MNEAMSKTKLAIAGRSEGTTSPKLQEQRKAAEKAKAILGALTPSRGRTDHTIFVLRYAANLAKTVL